MDIGDTLFSSLDSPFRPVRKVATVIVIFLLVFMPITFRHLLMNAVHVETVKAQHELTQVEQQVMSHNWKTTPTTLPTSGK